MKTIIVQAYETTDGQQFLEQQEAVRHQRSLGFTKYFLVRHGYDARTGTFANKEVVSVEATAGSHLKVAEDYCEEAIGSRIQYVQMPNAEQPGGYWSQLTVPVARWTIEELNGLHPRLGLPDMKEIKQTA